MRFRRFRYGYRFKASGLHKAVGDALRSSHLLGGYKIYQEYPVVKVNQHFYSAREKFDWVIHDLKIVIECHGEQHYKPVSFGRFKEKTTQQIFAEIQHRDEEKKIAALEAGFSYCIVPYTDQDKITEEYLLSLIENNRNTNPLPVKESPEKIDYKALYAEKKERDEKSGFAEQHREFIRERRKKEYARFKQQRDASSTGGRNGSKSK